MGRLAIRCPCGHAAVHPAPPLCTACAIRWVERTATATLRRFAMLRRGQRVLVAASGGKDSLTLAYLLVRTGLAPDVVAIDEGIAGYRARTLADLQRFCHTHHLPLRIVSFQDSAGRPLDDMDHQGRPPCSACGIFRRDLLARAAAGYDALATGHNLDDAAQTILLNLTLGHLREFWRVGPVTQLPGMTARIKPLYFVPERLVRLYAHVRGFPCTFAECPNARASYRAAVRDALYSREAAQPGSTAALVAWYVRAWRRRAPDQHTPRRCATCGAPTSATTCRRCILNTEFTLPPAHH